MLRLRFFSVFVLVGFVVGFIALTNASMAGGPTFQNFTLKPENLAGETCDGGECATIPDNCSGETLVSEVSVFTAKPGNIRVDFCAQFDTGCGDEIDLRCRVLVDGNQAAPGLINLGEAEDDEETTSCFTWYAPVQGVFKQHMTQVRCETECIDDSCDIFIDNYTHSVFFKQF